MNKYAMNGMNAELTQYETPFADTPVTREQGNQTRSAEDFFSNFSHDFESPFSRTYEFAEGSHQPSQNSEAFVQLLGELDDAEFSNSLYELASELEDTWLPKISNELAMGENYIPFATQHAREFMQPFQQELENTIEKVANHFSGNNLAEYSEAEIESFFTEIDSTTANFSPAQEQFFGSIISKIKSVVKTGVDLAKKGINAVGKILPVGIILNKIKKLVKPLLEKVLKFAIGKLPKNLRPHAQTLAKKFLNLETSLSFESTGNDISSAGELDAIQTELDSHIAQLLFSPDEAETENLLMNYESSDETLERSNSYETGGLSAPSLDDARRQFINELKDLQDGESPAPAIERFLPIAVMALRPVIKMTISLIGRQKVINFLAGILANLVGKYVPANVAKPLAAKIIDVGMASIGFETHELNTPDLAYEAIANTREETVQTMGDMSETDMANQEAMTMQLLEAFESAAANNFPSEYIRPELRKSDKNGSWVLKPRNGSTYFYKKFTEVFNITISPQTAATVTTFRKLPLADFLRDKLGLDPAKPIQAKLHLYEALGGTTLSKISKFENLPGLNATQPYSWVQLHPLTKQAASLLIKEAGLGRKMNPKYLSRRHQTAIGQRFYYLEINGARLKIISKGIQQSDRRRASQSVPNSGDAQAVINFIKSEIKFNYYFSEESSLSVVEKLNKNDFLGAALIIRHAVRTVLNGILLKNVGNKVKIIHEAFPEMYLEKMNVQPDQFSMSDAAKAIGGLSLGAGTAMLKKIVENLTDKLAEMAYQAVAGFFKSRAAEFKQAQAQPQDGVTVKIIWSNIPGLSGIRAVINAIAGNLPVGNLGNLSIPNLSNPEIKIVAGRTFD